MKVCLRCHKTRRETSFHFRNKLLNKRHQECKDCMHERINTHYSANKKYYVDKAKENSKKQDNRNRLFVCEYLSKHPCIDCGEDDIIVLEFDHQRDKSFAVSTMSNRSIQKILEEIEKCEVRCANCHRRKTAKQLSHYRTKYMPVG